MACGKSELCLFDRPFPQVVVENSNFEEIFPINAVTGKNLIDLEFKINGSDTDYLDLNDTLLCIKLVVEEPDKVLTKDANVVPSNFFFHTLFRDAILSFNNTKIEGGNNCYAQKALLESILTYSNDTKDTNLDCIGYSTQEQRKNAIAESKSWSLCGPLQFDFFNQPKYLLPGINVHIRLQRNNPSFCLFAEGIKPIIKITDARLIVRRVKVDQSVMIGHALGLEKHNALYPIKRTKLVTYSLPKGSLNFYKDQIFGDDRLPKFVLITFQNTSQLNGDYSKNATKFEHMNVSSIQLSRNTDFNQTYTVDFENNDYTFAYVQSIIRNMHQLEKNWNLGVSLLEFKEYYPFFTFDLTPDFDMNQTQVAKQGNLRLDLKFSKGLEKATSVIIYGIFDDEIQITKNRSIIV